MPMTDGMQINLERMMPELEDYINKGLFTHDEIKKVISTRRRHEAKVQRFDKKLVDIVRYIESEISLEKIRDKRLKQKEDKHVSRSYVDKRISRRVIRLYKDALYRYDDKKLIVMFTEYAIKKDMLLELKDVYAKCCLKKASDADLWIYCACMLYEVDDIDGSRTLFLKAIRLLPNNYRIRREFMKMEVENICKLKRMLEIDEADDEILEVPYNVYIDNIQMFGDENTKKELLSICTKVPELYNKCSIAHGT